METRLKSVFRNPKLRLAHKAAIFAALLWILQSGAFGFWSLAIFFGGAFFLYAIPMFRTLETGPVFLVLLVNTLVTLMTFNAPWYFLSAAIYFTTLFYLLLGVKELSLVQREQWRRLLMFGLAYPAFLLFFYARETGIGIKLIALFVELLVLTKGVFLRRMQSWLVSALSLEVTWALLFLPVGFISQAGIAALFYFLIMDLVYHHLEARVTKKIVLMHVTMLVLLTLFVFALSRWGI